MIARMVIAYVFWFFLGGLGVHRLFLGRLGSGAMMLVMSLSATGLTILGFWPAISKALEQDKPDLLEDTNYLVSFGISPLVVVALAFSVFVALWWLLDLVMVALMVLKDARDQDGPGMGAPAYAANMDPSFQASMPDGAWDETRPRRSALPHDYVMPWRQADARGEQKIYKPGED